MNFQSLEDLYINFVLLISILFKLNCINLNKSFMFCKIKEESIYKLSVQHAQFSRIEPVFTPIRGGTDGSRLTEMGIPTPNIFTGGHNFHSRDEWCSLNELSSACEVLINLAQIFAEN